MLGPIEAAMDEPAHTEEERQDFELLHRNAMRLLKMVNALLDFSRIEAGRVQAEFEPVDLAVLTSEIGERLPFGGWKKPDCVCGSIAGLSPSLYMSIAICGRRLFSIFYPTRSSQLFMERSR